MTVVEPLRVGMIGVGRHARPILLPAIAQLPEQVRLVAFATTREETARAAEAQFRVRTHVGYEALIADPEVEAVLVVGGKHGPEILAALEAGKPVWTETPGITSVDDARRIRTVAHEKGLLVQVGSCLRYAPVYQKQRRLLDAWRATDPGPRTYAVRYFPYVGHFYNLLLYLGGDIATVCAVGSPDGSAQMVVLRFASGEIGGLAWQRFVSNALPYERVEISGATGLLAAEDGRTLRFHRTGAAVANDGLSFDDADASLFDAGYSIPYGRNGQLYARGYVPELAHFVHCVRTGESPICGVDDAEKTLLVGQAVRRSVEAGGVWTDVERGSWAEAPAPRP
jgi:predicted dehydrogenase